MRQKDDKQFAELLNRLREGNHTTNDIQVLKQRILKLKYSEENYPIKSTHLFPENEDVVNTTIGYIKLQILKKFRLNLLTLLLETSLMT